MKIKERPKYQERIDKNEIYSSAETLQTQIYSPHEKTKFLNC